MSTPICAAYRSPRFENAVGPVCPQCGHHPTPHPRASTSLSIAFSLGAAVLLIPAYALPVMSVDRFGHAHADTIFSGVWKLWHCGLWGLAAIVFIASMLFPVLKLTGLGLLLLSLRQPRLLRVRGLDRLHLLIHRLGRWSMLDVFLVAFLSGIVRFHGLVVIEARPGIVAFGASVVLTMLATAPFPHEYL